ncbi:redoxin domain-containing protein [Sporothrix schenckii 1099-18]|uniref:thioredoxin-dependent peroxiredoxin n=2 Tax=Sporothrix schenckii TaxID=29908 RepID=U7PSY7_SPOS1|nr:redoxin domain-containing protein [Sporothrix schenckii 1099-18]ERS98758.1 hypothetical protein HMPREF1624_05546 [Sporothrix schenckii ATCC 58251]KJR89050.1 redoxin domain-containing protein [Sporothrix schenckii 1099-18]
MPNVTEECSATWSNFHEHAPDFAKGPIIASRNDIISKFDRSAVVKEGQRLPEFELQDALGKSVSLKELLSTGALLITFYRGSWCPFCNIALRHLQAHIDDFAHLGVTLVAISPELPDTSLTATEKLELKFTVLSDVGNGFARQLGIVWKQPDALRPVFDKFGHNLPGRNGDDSFEVPVPTTLLVDKDGIVRNIHVDPDYTTRLDPEVALGWAKAL